MSVTIYHNPRCSKSRQGLQLLRDQGIEPEVVQYLKSPLTVAELDRILGMLAVEPRELMRRKEKEYKEFGLGDESKTPEELLQAMVDHPKLIERPIVVKGGRAVIGRPTEKILEIL